MGGEKSSLDDAYAGAVEEAKKFSAFLSSHFAEFKNYRFSRTAKRLHVPENMHFAGKYQLTVGDILNNRNLADAVAMGSHSVKIGKFAVKGSFIAGKGTRYGIPLMSLVPEKAANLLMAGPIASYSSLASSSAGTVGTSIATGEAAGAAAVFCIASNENPGLLNSRHERYQDFKAMLKEKGMYLPENPVPKGQKEKWALPAARRLQTLGLVAAGTDNNLRYEESAKEKDLAFILINGVYRLDKSLYSKELNTRLRPFITNAELSLEAAVKMLGALYGYEGETAEVYRKLCQRNFINGTMQKRLSEDKVLTMEDVYYLGVYNIQSFTGKTIPD